MIADTIPEDFRRLRTQNDLSFKEMGRLLGVAEITVRKYESGEAVPSLDTLYRLADECGVILQINPKNMHPTVAKRLLDANKK